MKETNTLQEWRRQLRKSKNSLKLALEYATREYKDGSKIFRNHK